MPEPQQSIHTCKEHGRLEEKVIQNEKHINTLYDKTHELWGNGIDVIQARIDTFYNDLGGKLNTHIFLALLTLIVGVLLWFSDRLDSMNGTIGIIQTDVAVLNDNMADVKKSVNDFITSKMP